MLHRVAFVRGMGKAHIEEGVELRIVEISFGCTAKLDELRRRTAICYPLISRTEGRADALSVDADVQEINAIGIWPNLAGVEHFETF